jgi:uracil phosphoribosyltransferase
MPTLVEVSHPLVQHHLAGLRDERIPPWEFRQLVQRLAQLVAYEATKDLLLVDHPIRTPLAPMNAKILAQRIGLVPILRAGLGMVDTILNLIPTAEVWHLGLYRDETTALPVEYYCKLPKTEPVEVAMVLDPMLATGGSIIASLEALDRWGVRSLKVLSLIAAQPGIAAVQEAFPQASIYVCAIDPALNARKFIVPGLGDAGDRIFNTLRHEA